ncbi:MAG: GNAT family N-acetyltransferase [Rhodocyclaceae bacterium]|nr:GNAT family N-acetyltransferase [Rhodocyclaceae bacterium]
MTSEDLGSDDAVPSHPEARLDVRCGQGIPGLLALRDAWSALVQELPDARFHHQFAWTLSYLRNLEREEAAVHFFSFYRAARPVAIFSLRRTRRTVAGIPLRVWELPFSPHMNLCDILVARAENSAALLCELVRVLKQRTDLPWDALYLPNLLDDSVALRALQAAPLRFIRLVRSGQSMYFPCASLDVALRNATGQFKRKLRRQRKKLDQRGRVELTVVREQQALDAALVEFLQVEASGWKGKHGSAIMLHRDLEAFYRDLMIEFGAEKRCAINLLKLDGKVIAALFGLVCGKRLNLLKIAYDEAYWAASPGNQLLHDVLSHCGKSASLAELSLVTGPPWALRWKPDAQDVWDAHVFNTRPLGLAAYAMTRLRRYAARAKSLLSRLGEAGLPQDFGLAPGALAPRGTP